MRRDLPPDFQKLVRAARRIAVQLVEMMDVDHHREMVFQRIGDDEIHARKNLRRQREIRRRAGVMMPAHRHAHMVKAFRAHEGAFICREGHAPVLPGRRLEIIAEVHPVHEKFRRPMRGRIAFGQPPHLRRIGRREGRLAWRRHGFKFAAGQNRSNEEGRDDSHVIFRLSPSIHQTRTTRPAAIPPAPCRGRSRASGA